TKATVGFVVQLSATPVTTEMSATGTSALHSTVIGAGLLAVGASLSVIVTVKLSGCVFPAASVAVKVTVEVPTVNTDPLAGPSVWVIVLPVQLSAGVGAGQVT